MAAAHSAHVGLLGAGSDEEGMLLQPVVRGGGSMSAVAKAAVAVSAGAAVAGAVHALALARPQLSTGALIGEAAASAGGGPTYGCGLIGPLPGITSDGEVEPETQRLIDGIKSSSTLSLVTYSNWNLAPQTVNNKTEWLSADFLFMPEQWGVGAVNPDWVRPAMQSDFNDSNGEVSAATMADILLGADEPDIYGSCVGNMFGECSAPCDLDAIADGDCPAAHFDGEPIHANAKGQCDCWSFTYATGVGFWPFAGCDDPQPLPKMWSDPKCVDTVMRAWRETAKIAESQGYKYLSTPLVASNMEYARNFVEKACETCHDISCGCPVYVAFHYYAFDCQPEKLGGYSNFQKKLDYVAKMMDEYPFLQGAIISGVRMMNCAGEDDNPICAPNSGKYPALQQEDHGCPSNDELPDGLATFMGKLFDMVIATKTSDGRPVVKSFSWFNEDMAGGTYNLRLFEEDGKLNKLGEAYMEGCSRWGMAQQEARLEALQSQPQQQ